MAETTISGLTALATPPATGDEFVLVDVSDSSQAPSGTTKRIAASVVFTSPTIATPTLTSPTLTSPTMTGTITVTGATITGLTAASVATGTFPGVYTITGAVTLSSTLQVSGAVVLLDRITIGAGQNVTGAAASDLLLNAVTGQSVKVTVNGVPQLTVTSALATFAAAVTVTGVVTVLDNIVPNVDTAGQVGTTSKRFSAVRALMGVFGVDNSSGAYAILGDATAGDAFGYTGTVFGLDSRKTTSTASGDNLHAYLMTKQTVATTGTAQGLETWTWASHTSGSVLRLNGLIGNCEVSGVGGTVTQVTCVTGGAVVSGGTATTVASGKFGGNTVTGASSVITTAIGMHILPTTVALSGTLTNQYGIKIDAQDTASTLNWTYYAASSATSGGTTFRDTALATGATVGHLFIPTCAGTPTGVPANNPTGQIAMVFDTNNSFLYFYTAGAWRKSTVYA